MDMGKIFAKEANLAPLASFRIIFGLLMLFSSLRFWLRGWIYELYILPQFHFKYWGFEWVEVLPPAAMYLVFALMSLAALCIALGLFYRLAAVLFFLLFTYVELLDVANYLNHYYFVSLVSLLMIFLPAHRRSSLDVRLGRVKAASHGHFWHVNSVRLLLALVYFYAGVAKLHPQWLFEALPLKLWLPANSHLPLIGPLLNYGWVAFAFSWFGAIYDLSIPFLLWNRKTRPWAYLAVIAFHVLTFILFPIGVFPWVMIFSTLIFFSAKFHGGILYALTPLFGPEKLKSQALQAGAALKYFLTTFFIIQLLLPFRYLLYPGELFWHEQGFRFGWRVMLMEKAGYVTYTVSDPSTGRSSQVAPSEYLSPWQEKQLSTQPDLILQFAHFLDEEFRKEGINDPVVTAKAYVTLNGERSRLLIDPAVDLSKIEDSFAAKNWITPYEK